MDPAHAGRRRPGRVALGYVVYMVRSGLRAGSSWTRFACAGCSVAGRQGWARSIALMYWIFFVTMVMLLVSGGLLYFGFYSGYDVAMLHWVGTG